MDDPLTALRRVATAPTIVLLDGGAQGESYLSWGEHLEAIAWDPSQELGAWLDGLSPRIQLPTVPPRGAGWCDFQGGVFLQLDYEAPVTPPRAWRALGWVTWHGGREPAFHGSPERCARLRAQLAAAPAACPAPALMGPPRPACDEADYRWRIERIQALIAAGTLYQANLTLPFVATHQGTPNSDIGTYLALAELSPAPYSAFIRAPGRPSIVSHSPECFLRGRGANLWSVPIKGTRRRLPGREAAARAELASSPKDQAELTMIVDLVRNDLGRIAVPGSVQVEAPSAVMDLSYAHHLYGVVGARLPPATGYGAAIAAAFPAGSITGAPKRQAISELRAFEDAPRGAYCGSFGWIAPTGCELSVAIRTMTVDATTIRIQAGGGIVADSLPHAEWDEVQVKAGTMLRALAGSHA